MNGHVHILYAYYEKNDMYRLNLIYFLTHGYLDNIDYTIVVNGGCSVKIPEKDNIRVIYRDNTGFDFQGYYTALLSLKDRNMFRPDDYYLFLNCTVCGPFLPPYAKNYFHWYKPYLDLLKNNVKLVGSTINLDPSPHVQSYLFLMDYQGVTLLLDNDFFKLYETREEVIKHQEIGMSQLFLKNGSDISCLIPEYQNINYRQSDILLRKGDIRFSKELIGRDLLPYEVIFIKSMWGDPTDQIMSMIQLNLPQMEIKNNICQKVIYGTSSRKGLNVTKLLRRSGVINIYDMLPNNMFGDPCLGHPKYLWIYCDQSVDPIILKEYCGHFLPNKYKYIFYRDGKELHLFAYFDNDNFA